MRATATPLQDAGLRTRAPAQDDLVFLPALLRADTPPEVRALTVAADVWPTGYLIHGNSAASAGRIRFDRFPPSVRPQAKAIFWRMLREEMPAHLAFANGTPWAMHPSPATVYETYKVVTGWYAWAAEHGFTQVHDLDPGLVGDYGDELRSSALAYGSRAVRITCIERYWAYSLGLPTDLQFPEPPWLGKSGKRSRILGVGRSPASDNATTPIGQEPMARILRACIDLILKADGPRSLRKVRGYSHADIATACMLVIGYLTGMRAQEARELRRGCATIEIRANGLRRFNIRGLAFKREVDADGRTITAGVPRDQPWVTVEIAHVAVRVAERIAERYDPDGELLFPRTQSPNREHHRTGSSIATTNLLKRIRKLLIKATGHASAGDPEPINVTRLRRTLAWHIARVPGGEIALGVQYGHLRITTGQGYAARAETGFAELLAHEDLDAAMERLDSLADEVDEGATVSGPAADRLIAAVDRFRALYAGVAATDRDATRLQDAGLADIHFNERGACVCVYTGVDAMDVAACHPSRTPRHDKRTPNLDRCVASCGNTARLDGHITQLARNVEDLLLAAAASPRPLAERLTADAQRNLTLIERHQRKAERP